LKYITMKKLLVLAISSAILLSCNNASENSTSHQEVAVLEENHYNESSEPLELNDGERWVVNEEMKPFLSKGEELLNTYMQAGQADHKELASQLQEQNNLLIQ